MGRTLLALALALLALPLADAQGERAAALIQYVEGASPPPPDALDAQLPATRIDGAHFADRAPEGRPESALAHFRELQRLLLLRSRTGAPVELALEGRQEGLEVVARATVVSSDLAGIDLTLVLVEDGALVALPEGEREARFVARAIDGPSPVGTPAIVERRFAVDPSWSAGRLYVVAYAQRDNETLQAAVWKVGAQSASRQSAKLVLVEHATAAWCQPCLASDDSFALLASQQGEVDLASRGGYARAPDAYVLGGLALGGILAFTLWRRRPA